MVGWILQNRGMKSLALISVTARVRAHARTMLCFVNRSIATDLREKLWIELEAKDAEEIAGLRRESLSDNFFCVGRRRITEKGESYHLRALLKDQSLRRFLQLEFSLSLFFLLRLLFLAAWF